MKTILITGSAGFIGTSLKKFLRLHRPSYEVYGVDNRIPHTAKKCFQADLSDPRAIAAILNKVKPRYIFHMAGAAKAKQAQEFIRKNVAVTGVFLKSIALYKGGLLRVIIPGSAAEYGEVASGLMPISEDAVLRPVNPYGISKMRQTFLALDYQKKGLDIVIARIFNITGYGVPESLAIGRFAAQIARIEKGESPELLTKNLLSKRDFLDIEDVCCALVAIAEKGESGQIYNICSGKARKIGNLLKSLIGFSRVKKLSVRSAGLLCLEKEIKDIWGSNAKIKKVTGWRPRVKLEQSLKNTLKYYREQKK